MKITRFLIGLPLLAMLTQIVSATSTGMIGSTGQTMGPLGLLISLGFEYFPTVQASTALFIYRWIAFIAIFAIALLADRRSSTIIGVGAVIVSAFCAYVGWFTVPLPSGGINPAGPWSLIILMAILTVISYFTEQNKIQYGLSSPGDVVMKLFMFLVIFNSFIGIMSSSYIFSGAVGLPSTPPLCNSNNYANCAFNQTNGMAQLQSLQSSPSNNGGVFGIFTGGLDLVMSASSIAINALFMIASVALSLVFVTAPLLATYPWIWQSTPALGFLGLFQVFVWFIYYLWAARIWGKVMPGELRI
jgi:hypothetical protein